MGIVFVFIGLYMMKPGTGRQKEEEPKTRLLWSVHEMAKMVGSRYPPTFR